MLPAAEVRYAVVGDIRIAYEVLGAATDPPVVLVSGLSGQLTSWDDGFCRLLLDRHLSVVRFDNRDVGLSSHLAGGPEGPLVAAYTLSDMAADVVGLLDHLGLASAHVVGVSLGGMIAQVLAIEHPDRVRSLTSIMSTTGADQVGQPTEAAMGQLLMPPVRTRDEAAERAVQADRVLGSPGYRADEGYLRDRAARAFDRAFDPAGVGRQLAAALHAPDRTADLRRLDVPTLVVHGAADQLIAVSGGRATAAAVPGAELVVIEGMGHELPRTLWPTVVEHIAAVVARAEGRRSS